MRVIITGLLILLVGFPSFSQSEKMGTVLNLVTGEPVPGATVLSGDSSIRLATDGRGRFSIAGKFDSLLITVVGFKPFTYRGNGERLFTIYLVPAEKELEGVVVSGTMRPVKRLESAIAVEVYTTQFLKKNPAPSLFESLQNVNGVRPQLNCSVCNTGDIHINGLEGPYTMVTIDGMPIVSSLASVYGLFGIPSQLIDRIEIVKGPASGLYGSEAIGGLINIITKSPENAPRFTGSVMSTSWLETNVDLGTKFKIGKKLTSLLGVNYFHYGHKLDKNNDNFTDVTLQHRISLFNKFSWKRNYNRIASLAARYFYEDRWGGDMRWSPQFRGGDSIYGESIYTGRWEIIGNYQLPIREKMFFSFSATQHDQNSWYGTIPFMAKQRIAFGQLIWDKAIRRHHLLGGAVARFNYYDDNSTATIDTLTGKNKPDKYLIPGVFIQDEWKFNSKHMVLAGLRYDYHLLHGSILTPRVAWKWKVKEKQVLRFNLGTGFRVVSLFTEEHAALTGARAVKILESLKPERSYNANINYTHHYQWPGIGLNVDASMWYSYFTNQILPDYDTDPNKIIYRNLRGNSISRGFTLNLELNAGRRLKSLIGVTIQDVMKTERNKDGKLIRTRPVLTERWSSTWSVSYTFPSMGVTLDYTGNIYGPMRLPLLSPLDPRPGNSPVWSIQNIQVTKLLGKGLEIFGGIKNLLNWTPSKKVPFLIARTNDPFDKHVAYNPDGTVKVVNDPSLGNGHNPFGLSFDPTYVYAPNQGMRVFVGVRF